MFTITNCRNCSNTIEIVPKRGRKKEFCDVECKKEFYKKNKSSEKMKDPNEIDYISITKNQLSNGTLRRIHDQDDDYYLYEPQLDAATEIIANFSINNRWVLLKAEMQSGKSGTFFSIPYIISKNKKILTRSLKNLVDEKGVTNTFLITGMNDRLLKDQFLGDFLQYSGPDYSEKILRNHEMQNIISFTEGNTDNYAAKRTIEMMKRDCLIIVDESDFGASEKQTLKKFYDAMGIDPTYDKEQLIERNTFIISVSATPFAESLNISENDSKKKVVHLKTTEKYFGISKMYKMGLIKKSFQINDIPSANKLLKIIKDIKSNGYFIVRLRDKRQDWVIDAIKKSNDPDIKKIEYIRYDGDNKDIPIKDILSECPDNKTIIFIKGMFTAGKRLETKNIRMTFDTPKSKTDTAVQSLLGRCCGYGKNENIFIYCDEEEVKSYRDWVESGWVKFSSLTGKNISGDNEMVRKRCPEIENRIIDIDQNLIEYIESGNMTTERKKEVLNRIIDEQISRISDKLEEYISFTNVDPDKKTTTYTKNWTEPIKSGQFFGDSKTEYDPNRPYSIAMKYNIKTKQILLMVSKFIKRDAIATEKSIYTEKTSKELFL